MLGDAMEHYSYFNDGTLLFRKRNLSKVDCDFFVDDVFVA